MLQIVPKSIVVDYVVMIILQLKWAWDYLIYQSFFQHSGIGLPEYADKATVYLYEKDSESEELEECSVCLCKVDEGDEVTELRCNHLFHIACLDRWLGYGNMTCPLCRINLRLTPCAAELHQELIIIDYGAAARSSERCQWWLR
ncbi:hypothetical protein CDL12_01340 [Handroanthus impetiginosus]|uniref:RING-type domain-containing protein n=1 Tax=Handroanthus impetiginosus TaxID=429701 RepID=A0A2G9I852_9LAMI|nr:hypothetical protein CDL12_01340 [Handroanthus impetiginosus]